MTIITKNRTTIIALCAVVPFLHGCLSEPGLVAYKYEGNWSTLPNFSTLSPVQQTVVPEVGTHGLGTNDYGLVLKGMLKISAAGAYTFHLRSDDGSRLWLNGTPIIENDGVHTARSVASQAIDLSAGNHELRVEYFQASSSQLLTLHYQLNGGAIVPVSSEMLVHGSTHNQPDSGGGTDGDDGSGGDGGTGGDNGSGGDGGTGGSDPVSGTDRLGQQQHLQSNSYLVSENGDYRFYLQTDGNLVLRDWNTRNSLWSSGTHGDDGVQLVLQDDGNLVLYTASQDAVWATNTNGSNASQLILRNDGNLVLQSASGSILWATNTAQGSDPDGVKVAFIGDTGYGSNFQSVLNLIKQEGAQLTVVAGDTSYSSSGDDNWDAMVRDTLGSSDPALVVAGNHDYGDSDFGDVRSFGESRLNRQNAVQCEGEYAEKMTCTFRNLYFVMSAIGSGGSRSDHETFISRSLQDAPDGMWRICAWHKNQRNMQVGGKSDEVGWTAYETCRQQGAIISTGHEHSYSRTHLLSDMSEQTVSSTASSFTVRPGRTFAFVSGLGGINIRDQERGGNWWASIYTSTQGARYGALFGTFYEDRADFYFKNINGQIIDQFTVLKGY